MKLLKKAGVVVALAACLISPSAKTLVKAEGSGVRNILLIGSDRRDESWNGNSDVMILATINSEAQKVVLTSFMRDLYADIPGHGVHKLNYAYAVGGADTLKATLENNYQLSIDDYACVDFNSMAAIIDIIGGVELTISDDEANVLNGYLVSMEHPEYSLSSGGTYVLNGYQAVAHMRDRYVGAYDYERTQRQRDVLAKIFEQAGSMTPEQITSFAEEITSEVNYSFNALELMALIAEIPEISTYEMDQNRIPYDDLYHSQSEMLVPDFGATVARLHESLGID